MLKGKSAIITGSTSGIGRGIATMLAREGVNVMLNGFGDGDEIEELRQELSALSGASCVYSAADMTRPDEIKTMVDEAQTAFGAIDIVVNNAGIQLVSPIEEFPVDKWDAIIAINMNSAFHTIRHTLPGMKSRGWGRIINLASAHSLVASPYKSAYVAAKHGLVGMTKSVALECATDGVTVNAISPGYVMTPLVANQIPATAKTRGISEEDVIQNVMLARQPTKKFITIEEVADTAKFLCSDGARSITGANISIDGGWTAA